MKMISCGKCYKDIPDDSNFCPFCGVKVERSEIEVNRNDIPVPADPTNIEAVLKRAFIFLEDGLFDKADRYLEVVLDQDPENAKAYVGKLMIDLRIKTQETLSTVEIDYINNSNYKKAIRYGDDDLVKFLTQCSVELEKKETIYKICEQLFDCDDSVEACEQVIQLASEIKGYKNIDKMIEECEKEIERRKADQSAIEEDTSEDESMDTANGQSGPTNLFCIMLIVLVTVGLFFVFVLVDVLT